MKTTIKQNKLLLFGVCTLLGLAHTAAAQSSNLVVNPTTLTFNTASGTTSSTQNLTVTSAGAPVNFTASAQSAGNWLAVTPATGTTPQALTVTASTGSLATGTYGGLVTLTAGGSTVSIPVVFNVNSVGPSSLSVAPSLLNFNFAPGSTAPSSQSVFLSSGGASVGTVTATTVTSNGSNFVTVTPSSATISPSSPNTFSVSVNPSGLSAGTYNAVVAFAPPGTNGAVLPVVVTVAPAAALSVSPASVNFAFQTGTGAPPPQILNITSANGSTVPFSANASTTTCGGNWLVVSPQSGATPGSLSVQLNTASLQAGSCTGQITISAPGSSTPTITVPVNLTVSATPILQVPTTGPTFTYQLGSSPPASQNVQITSSTAGLPITVTATPVTGGANFLTVTPGTGTTPQAIAISVNPTVLAGLAPNTYVENVTVTATGAGNSPQTFPVTLVVSSVPILSTSQTSLNFNYQIGQTPPQSQVLTLSSTGAPLNFVVAATSANCNNFLSATPTSGQTQVPPGQPGQVVVSVNTSGITTPTVCTGTLTLTVPGSTNPPVIIPVTLNASTTPLINVSQGAIAATAVAGTTTTVQQNISLTSTDLTTALNFAAAAVTNPPGLTWLTVTPNTGSTPNVLNVTLNPTGLPVGIYMGSIVRARRQTFPHRRFR